jgi:hypothetical protein
MASQTHTLFHSKYNHFYMKNFFSAAGQRLRGSLRLNAKTLFLLIGCGLTIYFAACKKDNTEPIADTPTETNLSVTDREDVNRARNNFAQTLARAMNDPQVRQFVHGKLQQADDPNYEFLYIAEKNSVLPNGMTFAQVLANYGSGNGLNDAYFQDITEIDPLLMITIQEGDNLGVSNWNLNTVPEVAAVPTGPQTMDSYYPVYNGNGQRSNRQLTNTTQPVLGVCAAEASYLVDGAGTTIDGVKLSDLLSTLPEGKNLGDILPNFISDEQRYTVKGNEYYLIGHGPIADAVNALIIEEGDGGGGEYPPGGGNPPGDGPCNEPCARDCETLPEMLVDYKINGWSVFQNIRNQPFETKYVFHGDVSTALVNSLGTVSPFTIKYVSGVWKKGDLLDCSPSPCQGKWKKANFAIGPDWDMAQMASPYFVSWAEVDPGTTTVSFGIPTTVKFKVGPVELSTGITFGVSRTGAAIVDLGRLAVFYCDPIMKQNNTGSITFRCN